MPFVSAYENFRRYMLQCAMTFLQSISRDFCEFFMTRYVIVSFGKASQ